MKKPTERPPLRWGTCAECGPGLWLDTGMRNLRTYRTGDGRWRRFPLHFTLLALSETNIAPAIDERRYAAPVCERLLKRRETEDSEFEPRRRAVAARVLAKC